MDEEETLAALTDLQAFIPDTDSSWVGIQMQHIRSKGKGYWIPPYAVELLKEIEAKIVIG